MPKVLKRFAKLVQFTNYVKDGLADRNHKVTNTLQTNALYNVTSECTGMLWSLRVNISSLDICDFKVEREIPLIRRGLRRGCPTGGPPVLSFLFGRCESDVACSLLLPLVAPLTHRDVMMTWRSAGDVPLNYVTPGGLGARIVLRSGGLTKLQWIGQTAEVNVCRR